MDPGITNVLYFVFLGFLGGFTYVLMDMAEKWEDLITFPAFKRCVIGGIVGLVYYIGYSEHNFPNGLMCFISGYAGTSFIQKLVTRVRTKL